MRRPCGGFTLLEIVVALVLFTVVATALTRMVIVGQRVTATQRARTTLQSSLRVGALVVPSELRMLNQGDSTDIAAISDTSISYRAMRGYFTLCTGVASATSIQVIGPQPSAFTVAYRAPSAGDSAFLFYEDDTLTRGDDRWVPLSITGVATGNCTFGGTSYRAYTLTLGGTGIDLTTHDLARFLPGAPVRSFELTTLVLYETGGRKWLGMCGGALGCTPEPLFGPLAPAQGVRITRYDRDGGVVSGTGPTDRARLRSLRIRFIGVTEQMVDRGGGPRSPMLDTLWAVVDLRTPWSD